MLAHVDHCFLITFSAFHRQPPEITGIRRITSPSWSGSRSVINSPSRTHKYVSGNMSNFLKTLLTVKSLVSSNTCSFFFEYNGYCHIVSSCRVDYPQIKVKANVTIEIATQ